jgi:hypothetical protein
MESKRDAWVELWYKRCQFGKARLCFILTSFGGGKPYDYDDGLVGCERTGWGDRFENADHKHDS